MSIHWKFFRLHLLWFILYNLFCIFILFQSEDARLVLLIKAAGYPAINFISRPFSKQHDYYFENMGYNPGRVFILICLVDFFAFWLLTIFITFLF